jgi:cyclopropane fatty-acyl-phospholipid synthase-like methyltransferase
MLWIHSLTERDADLMNPTGHDKLRALARALGLAPGRQILDVGAGRGGPALLFAREFGCHVTAVEPHGEFLETARARASDAGLSEMFDFVQTDGASFAIDPGRFDVAMCLGATWAWGGLGGTLDALAAGVRSGGHVVAGEPFRHDPADPVEYEMHPWTLPEVLERFEERGLAVTTLIRSSTDDWDAYTSEHVRALLDWLEENPDHPERETVRGWRKDEARRLGGPSIGWAMVAGRKTDAA